MKCETCGNPYAARVRIGYQKGIKYELCDACGKIPAMWMPDIYLGTKGGLQTDPNICDDKGNEIPFSSKREKAAIMKTLGLRQADSAERNSGARNESHLKRKTYFIQ